jgi:predicted RNase H-like HicB family nuclease
MRQVLIYRGEDGFWVAECPSLPGCVSQGETQETALANIKEAIQALERTSKASPPSPATNCSGIGHRIIGQSHHP